MKKKVFSGIQPTGRKHIGNLIGALSNWVSMQDQYDAIYNVVDLHSMTVPYEPETFKKFRLETARMLLAVGIDPTRSLLYFQSQVPQHAELTWILSTLVGVGQMERMTQFKEKSEKWNQNMGLLSYPILMAADILLHRVHAVPVGDDQTQHLELTRDLATRFNGRFGEIFPIPERITPKFGARVKSLQDPTARMSTTDPSPASRIDLLDEPDVIRKKVQSAVTDSGREVVYDWEEKPEISNLLELFAFFSKRDVDDLVNEYRDAGYGPFKAAAADAIVEGLTPIRTRYHDLDEGEVARVMTKGALEGRTQAERSMQEIRAAVGLGSS